MQFPVEKIQESISKNNWGDVKLEIKNWLKNLPDSNQDIDPELLEGAVYASVRAKMNVVELEEIDRVIAELTNVKREVDSINDENRREKIINKIKDL